jgi:Na+-transporting methylmalonyl-CoA/oxaloacetate decarboxylase gamma subunit
LENSLVTALGLTAVGMTLLFLALAFFYGLLSLMMAVIKDHPSQTASTGELDAEPGEQDLLLQAAAIAVALARAEAEQGLPLAGLPAHDESAGLVSPWWALHHQRQLALSSKARRV